MTKSRQISVIHGATTKLEGTLLGDWLAESIAPAEAAIKSDYLPALWVDGIDNWVKAKVSASLSKSEAALAKREADLAKREADLAKREANSEHWRSEIYDAARKASRQLECVMDSL